MFLKLIKTLQKYSLCFLIWVFDDVQIFAIFESVYSRSRIDFL